MIDYSDWNEYDGLSEGSGRSEKIWLTNPHTFELGLFKFKKDVDTTDHISERISYKLAQLLGIECARFEIGTYEGREGSMSYNIVQYRPDCVLVEGYNYILKKYINYDSSTLKIRGTDIVYSLEMIRKSIDGYIEFKDFLKIPMFDYLIGNTDRHQNNWAILEENGTYTLSPLYDNSSSLCAYNTSEKELDACLGKDQVKWNSVLVTKSRSIIRIYENDTKKPTHLQVLQYLKENYYNDTVDFVRKCIDNVTETNICDIMGEFSEDILSPKKKQVIIKFILSKVKMMKDIYFGEEE